MGNLRESILASGNCKGMGGKQERKGGAGGGVGGGVGELNDLEVGEAVVRGRTATSPAERRAEVAALERASLLFFFFDSGVRKEWNKH